MSNLKSCPDCGHKVSISAPTCPNCGRANPSGNVHSETDTINAFLWRFFGILFLLFVSVNMIRDYKESTQDELAESSDRLEQAIKSSRERIREALKEPNPNQH